MKKMAWAGILIAGFTATAAEAADNGIYAGLSLGRTKIDLRDPEPSVNDKDTGWKLFAGVRPLDWLGAEVSYFDLGKLTQQFAGTSDISDYRLEQSGFDAFGVAYFNVANVDFFAKAGVARWTSKSSFTGIGGPIRDTDHGIDFAWGVGAQLRFGSLAARLEFERFEINERPQNHSQMISVGLSWTFL